MFNDIGFFFKTLKTDEIIHLRLTLYYFIVPNTEGGQVSIFDLSTQILLIHKLL